MKQLIADALSWEELGEIHKTEYQFELGKGVLHKEAGRLTLPIHCNFVMPFADCEKVKAVILHKLDMLKEVELDFSYRDFVMPKEDAARLYVPHMVRILNGSYLAITKTIVENRVMVRDGCLYCPVLGKVAAEQLNERVAQKFREILKETFDFDMEIIFENDEELLAETLRSFHESEAKDIERSMREYREVLKTRAKERPQAADSGTGGGFGAGGGFGGGNNGGGFGGNAAGAGSKKQGGWKRREKELPAEGNRIMGRGIPGGKTAELREIAPEMGVVILEGVLFRKTERVIKSGNYLVSLLITDNKTTICAKAFVSENKWKEIDELLKPGDGVKLRGEVQWDTFENMNTVMYTDLEKTDREIGREDTWENGRRVELHIHSKMSQMDGFNEAKDIVAMAAKWGQPAVAVTDHGVVQAFPDCAAEAKKQGEKGREIKVIYGLEGYVFDDADCVQEDGSIDYKSKPTHHIIILAKTQEGLKNIYKLVSYSHLDYYYKKPRLPWSVIEANREGLIIGSACSAGEVFSSMVKHVTYQKRTRTEKIMEQKSAEEQARIASRYDYLEIQPVINNRFMFDEEFYLDGRRIETEDDIREINRRIVALADKLGKRVVATTDSHYTEPDDAIYRNIVMAGMGFEDAESGEGLYMKTTDEMMEEFSYLGARAQEIVVDNTNYIASLIDGDIRPVPAGKFPPKIEGAKETLRKTCMERAHAQYGDPLPKEIEDRLDIELNSIINNGYAVMYVSAQMLVNKSLEDGYLVGSRGSVGSSFAATMAGITEVNPLDPHYLCPNCKKIIWGDMQKYDCGVDMPPLDCPDCGTPMKRDGYTIPFATFLGFKGNKEPDIDLNFAGEYQPVAHRYVGTIFGEKNVFKAGTVGTVAEKTAYGYVAKFFEERNIPVNKYEKERLAQHCTGVKRTTGQHPGGIVICPDDHEIYEFCPVQHPANDTTTDIVTTHFDYHKIDENLLKLDILGHDVPSMIRQLQDMTGTDPLQIDLTDRKVLSIFNGIEALDIKDPDYKFKHGSYAIPEFGTSFTRQMLDDTKPDKFADLVRISGFSHGTDVWLNNAQDYIRSGTATMREVISTRDDIMNYLILKGVENETAFKIMEIVRKGKKDLDEQQVATMKEHNVPDWYIDSCNKIKYMFPRAHAVAYTMMSFRMAWYKVYYPQEFYATYFTTKVANFDAETILKGKEAILARMDEITAKGTNASAKEKDDYTILEVAYEMYARGYEFAPARLGKSDAVKFGVDDGKVLLPFVAIEGVGETAARAFAEEYAVKPFDTIEEAVKRAKLNKTVVEGLRGHGVFAGLPETDQLSMFM